MRCISGIAALLFGSGVLLACNPAFESSNFSSEIVLEVFDVGSRAYVQAEPQEIFWFADDSTEVAVLKDGVLQRSEEYRNLHVEFADSATNIVLNIAEDQETVLLQYFGSVEDPVLPARATARVTAQVSGFTPTALSEHAEVLVYAYSQTTNARMPDELAGISDTYAEGQNILSIENEVDFYLPSGPTDLFMLERTVKDTNAQIFELGRWHHREVNYAAGASVENEMWELDQFINAEVCAEDPGTITIRWPFADRRFVRPKSGSLTFQYFATVFEHPIPVVDDRLTTARIIEENTARFRSPNAFMVENASLYEASSSATRVANGGYDQILFETSRSEELLCEVEFATPATGNAHVGVTGTTLHWDWGELSARGVQLYAGAVSAGRTLDERPTVVVWTGVSTGTIELSTLGSLSVASVAAPVQLVEFAGTMTAETRRFVEKRAPQYIQFRSASTTVTE